MVYKKIKFSVKHNTSENKRWMNVFCYNAHQPINHTVTDFINTVVDHLITMPMYKVIYFTTNKEHASAVLDCFN